MNAYYWGSVGTAPRILDLDTMEVSGQLHAPGRFVPRERATGTHWIGGRVGPRAGLDAEGKIKFPVPVGT
jgi:hypothetical protein